MVVEPGMQTKAVVHLGCIPSNPDPPSVEGEEADQIEGGAAQGDLLVCLAGSYEKDILGEAVMCIFCDKSLRILKETDRS